MFPAGTTWADVTAARHADPSLGRKDAIALLRGKRLRVPHVERLLAAMDSVPESSAG